MQNKCPTELINQQDKNDFLFEFIAIDCNTKRKLNA